MNCTGEHQALPERNGNQKTGFIYSVSDPVVSKWQISLYLKLWYPYPFMYLKADKGTHFRQSLFQKGHKRDYSLDCYYAPYWNKESFHKSIFQIHVWIQVTTIYIKQKNRSTLWIHMCLWMVNQLSAMKQLPQIKILQRYLINRLLSTLEFSGTVDWVAVSMLHLGIDYIALFQNLPRDKLNGFVTHGTSYLTRSSTLQITNWWPQQNRKMKVNFKV